MLTKFSITGYSLGGLHARYVIAILQQNNFFNKAQPVNFVTIATPHIGIPGSPGSLFSRIVRVVGSNMLGNTGQQLYALDDWAGTGRPLLEVMADKGAHSFTLKDLQWLTYARPAILESSASVSAS